MLGNYKHVVNNLNYFHYFTLISELLIVWLLSSIAYLFVTFVSQYTHPRPTGKLVYNTPTLREDHFAPQFVL
jgi:hypothetical protein